MIALAVILPILLGWGVLEMAGVFDGSSTSDEDTPIEDDINEITTYKGDNDILGTAGKDLISSGMGDDTVNAGMGADTIDGGVGNDVLNGGVGEDLIEGNFGKDTISGNAFDDILGGGGQSDVISGGDGDDIILGNDGDDSLDGNRDNDVISGGGGADIVAGGKGDDRLFGGYLDYEPDATSGNFADYTAEYINAYNAAGDAMPGATTAEILNSDYMRGYVLTDGSVDGSDTLYGGEGNDSLYVGGNDVAKGGLGDDTFILMDLANGVSCEITDFKAGDAVQIYVPEGASDPVVTIDVDGENAIINVDGNPIATCTGAAGTLTTDMISLV